MIEQKKINIQNKKAGFEFEITDRFEAGIVLKGSEIKSIRNGGGSISEAFCFLRNNELYIRNMNIPEYSHGAYANHVPDSVRKLLLTKKELSRIDAKVREKGLTVIPLRLLLTIVDLLKLKWALAVAKRNSISEKALRIKIPSARWTGR